MSNESRHQETREIIDSVRLLQRISRQQTSEFIRKHRITGPQLGALRVVSMSPGISLRELSERLYLHISTVCGIVDRLEKRGYLDRERSAVDRRKVELKITSDGKRLIKRTPMAGMGLLIHTIDELPAAQLHKISQGLGALLDLMKIKDQVRRKI